MAADAAEADYGLTLKPVPKEVQKDIRSTDANNIIAGLNNPLDTGAAIDPDNYVRALEKTLEQDDVHAAITYLVPISPTMADKVYLTVLDGMNRVQKETGKPVLAVFSTADETVRKELKENAGNIAIFETTEDAANAMNKLCERRKWLDRSVTKLEQITQANNSPFAKQLTAEQSKAVKAIIQEAVNKSKHRL